MELYDNSLVGIVNMSMFKLQTTNSDKNEQGNHWGLLQYDNDGWKCELDETNTFIVMFLYIY